MNERTLLTILTETDITIEQWTKIEDTIMDVLGDNLLTFGSQSLTKDEYKQVWNLLNEDK